MTESVGALLDLLVKSVPKGGPRRVPRPYNALFRSTLLRIIRTEPGCGSIDVYLDELEHHC